MHHQTVSRAIVTRGLIWLIAGYHHKGESVNRSNLFHNIMWYMMHSMPNKANAADAKTARLICSVSRHSSIGKG